VNAGSDEKVAIDGPPALLSSLAAARRGRLYPAVILHGGSGAKRRDAALLLARAVLCEAATAARPCGHCRHCRRIVWPDGETTRFHPDATWLLRDLKTSTSVEATRSLMQAAQMAPFEARGQVFVVANAETLTPEAANAMLKVLEEPPVRAPRHFLLLAPSRLDLLPTLRSRSLSIFLGAAEPLDRAAIEDRAARLAGALVEFRRDGSPLHLLMAAGDLADDAGFQDARAAEPWARVAATVLRVGERFAGTDRRALLELSQDLLAAADWRLRGIAAERIVEGLVSRHLAR
jgi:hypothetical protein